MPKSTPKRQNGTTQSSPYSRPAKTPKSSESNTIFRMNTDLGQHILKNPGVADAIITKAGLKQSDIVLEVGPGTGNLTTRILAQARKCIAVEMDARMAAELTKRVQGTPAQRKLEILLGDVIRLPALPFCDVCISNTPYQISSPLVFKLLGAQPPPRAAVLMFQREFALRLVARPGDALYCRLSVNVQMWARVAHIMKVGRNNFNPPPQVESSVVRMEPRIPRPNVSMQEWDGLLRICFGRKNKTLRASFFGPKSLIDLLESNYRTWCAQEGVSIDEDDGEALKDVNMADDDHYDNDDDNDDKNGGVLLDIDMDLDDGEELPELFKSKGKLKKKRRGKVYDLVKEKVRRVLEDATQLAEKRARMCTQEDFLNLLLQFNLEGIHFS